MFCVRLVRLSLFALLFFDAVLCCAVHSFIDLFNSHRFRDGDTIDVLADALDDLRKTLKGVRAISFTGDSHDVIEYVANLFGPSKQNSSDVTQIRFSCNQSFFPSESINKLMITHNFLLIFDYCNQQH